jgi:hypothetical protein
MRTHRFGRKLKLPSTMAIKHQIRRLMFEDTLKDVEAARESPGEAPAVALASSDSIWIGKVAVANSTAA